MASISSIGVGSGIFSADLVDQLVQAERLPTETRLDQRQQTAQTKISAYGVLRSALEALKTPMEQLASADGLKAFTASSSNDDIGVTIDQGAASRGNYSVNVTQLAQAQSLASNVYADKDTTAVGTGTLTLNVGGESTDITVDGSNNTLQGLADAINDAGAGVSAGVVDTGSGYRLVLSSDESGTANEIEVNVTGGSGGLDQFAYNGTTQNLEQTVEAKDALLEVNGIAITRSSNTIEDVVDGVTFEVTGTGTSTVKVEQDSSAVADRVQEFVDKFNALQDAIKRVSGFDADSGVGSVLSGDSTVRNIQSEARSLLTTIVPGLEDSPVRMLADIGIKTDPSTGKLEFDQDTFVEKLEAHPAEVSTLFSDPDGDGGIAEQAVSMVEDMLASDGALASRTEGLNNDLDRIQDQREALELRIESFRERLVSQFSAADSLIAQLQSTGSYVAQQLAAIAPQNSSNS